MKAHRYMTGAAIWLTMCLPSRAIPGAEPPLPSMETAIRRVVENARSESDNDRAFNQKYFYTRTKVTEFRNIDGDLKKREEKQIVHDPAKKSTRRVMLKPAQKTTASPSVEAKQSPKVTNPNYHHRASERKELMSDPDLLNRFVFVLHGRETINGRDTLVVDFKPKTGKLPERNLKERFINHAAGRVWLDEAEYKLVKADLHLTEKVDVLDGIVGSVWTFHILFERQRTDDGLWFTHAMSWHLEGREAFLRRTVDYHEQLTSLRAR